MPLSADMLRHTFSIDYIFICYVTYYIIFSLLLIDIYAAASADAAICLRYYCHYVVTP